MEQEHASGLLHETGLRNSGGEQRAADAVVELVQSAAHVPDISGLATKADIAGLATAILKLAP
jgi:hypothetical protein